MPEKVLIVIDMLNDFIDAKGALYCGEAARNMIPFIQDRIETYRKAGDLVVYLTDSHDENDKEFEKFPKHGVAGTWGNQIIPELTPAQDDIAVPKKRFNGFFGTDLEERIASVKEAEVVGVCTSICVMDTVGGLVNRDFTVTVPKQGVADFDSEMEAFAFKRMERIYKVNIS